MAVTRATARRRDLQADPTTSVARDNSNSGLAAPNKSLFGDIQTQTGAASSKSRKRKLTDLNLEIVNMDKKYDLTLIVGSPENLGDQKAFQVNKGAFRNASNVWTAMLCGEWTESNMSEIPFPDDSPFAFEIVLHIAHWDIDALPTSLAKEQLYDLATLSDKYDLKKLVHYASELKKWMEPYRGEDASWPGVNALQTFAVVTKNFGYEEDFEFFVQKLAFTLEVENNIYYYTSTGGKKVQIWESLPTYILTSATELRKSMLQGLLKVCKDALQVLLDEEDAPCGKITCPLIQTGMLLRSLDAAGLHPLPETDITMEACVSWYWLNLERVLSEAPWLAQAHAVGAYCSKDSWIGHLILDDGKLTLQHCSNTWTRMRRHKGEVGDV